MTPRPRRKKQKGDSVIDGLRLERDTADKLCLACTKSGAKNIAEFARFCLRVGLGSSAAEANRREAEERQVAGSGLAGLGLDLRTKNELVAKSEQIGCTKASLARHYIRMQLGYTDVESTKREQGFSALASMYQGRADAFHGAGEE